MPPPSLLTKGIIVSLRARAELVGLGLLPYRATLRPHPRPIFILGNQKSGTTAIAALLGEATDLGVTLDLQREARSPTFHRVRGRKSRFRRLLALNWRSFRNPIIKEPNLTLFSRELRAWFPHAKLVFIVREPRDNIRSIFNRLELPGDRDWSADAAAEKVPLGWRPTVDGRQLGLREAHYVASAAERWNHLTSMYRREPEAYVLVRYEDFCRDKAGVIARLADALDLRVARDITREVDRQWQPRGDASVRNEDFFGPENERRILTLCASNMRALGYETPDHP